MVRVQVLRDDSFDSVDKTYDYQDWLNAIRDILKQLITCSDERANEFVFKMSKIIQRDLKSRDLEDIQKLCGTPFDVSMLQSYCLNESDTEKNEIHKPESEIPNFDISKIQISNFEFSNLTVNANDPVTSLAPNPKNNVSPTDSPTKPKTSKKNILMRFIKINPSIKPLQKVNLNSLKQKREVSTLNKTLDSNTSANVTLPSARIASNKAFSYINKDHVKRTSKKQIIEEIKEKYFNILDARFFIVYAEIKHFIQDIGPKLAVELGQNPGKVTGYLSEERKQILKGVTQAENISELILLHLMESSSS